LLIKVTCSLYCLHERQVHFLRFLSLWNV